MTYIFVSLISGAVGACLAVFFMANRFPSPAEKQASCDAEERLNAEQQEHERFMKEQQRQFDMLMKYTGERQK